MAKWPQPLVCFLLCAYCTIMCVIKPVCYVSRLLRGARISRFISVFVLTKFAVTMWLICLLAVVGADALRGINSATLSTSFKGIAVATSPLPDSMSSRRGEPTRYNLPVGWEVMGTPQRISPNPTIVGDLDPTEGVVMTDDSEYGYQLRKRWLDAHNTYRATEAKEANYMNKLIWDYHLEAYAEQWAKQMCINEDPRYFEHSPNLADSTPEWPFHWTVGENIFAGGGVWDDDGTVEYAINDFMSEKPNYNVATGMVVDSTKLWGHYTQIVRQEAQYVGCSLIRGCHANAAPVTTVRGDSEHYAFDGDTSVSFSAYAVCHYDYGNQPDYEGKYRPYTSAYNQQCSQCPTGYSCCESGNLCVGYPPTDFMTNNGLSPPTEFQSTCSNWKRTDNCAGTGASHVSDGSMPYGIDLPYNLCHCGKGPDPKNFLHTVEHAYYFYQGKCYIQTTEQDAVPADVPDSSSGESDVGSTPSTVDGGSSSIDSSSVGTIDGISGGSTSGSTTDGGVSGGSTSGGTTDDGSSGSVSYPSGAGTTPGAAGQNAAGSTDASEEAVVPAESGSNPISVETNTSNNCTHRLVGVSVLVVLFVAKFCSIEPYV
eukprot:Protomagalhaensia_wolfi_Nauph_80__2626@NODE_276_length_2954_cov_164_834648_g206_i0_p1_GENE_NODE_276_length_2954_cov_164_834648_g206_i0NODE_276_length_2954_cov_164_834648_g206_i0_p1_ORF_typecomplete_len596_score82_81CAP/PF00188_26/3_9e18CAP/PF00188_26/5_6e03_NODE_276_length_2954_cov_164_834648_g206_i04512238